MLQDASMHDEEKETILWADTCKGAFDTVFIHYFLLCSAKKH